MSKKSVAPAPGMGKGVALNDIATITWRQPDPWTLPDHEPERTITGRELSRFLVYLGCICPNVSFFADSSNESPVYRLLELVELVGAAADGVDSSDCDANPAMVLRAVRETLVRIAAELWAREAPEATGKIERKEGGADVRPSHP